MRNHVLFFSTLIAALGALAPTTFAQTADLITSIGGETFDSDNQTRYFNQANCDNPATVTFQDRITTDPGTPVTQVYVWVGGQNSECDVETNRTDITSNRCQPVAGEAAQTVDTNNLISNLTLGDLVDTGLVDCANTALQGQPYELYAFRNEPPGSQDVPPEGFGVASFTVDVTPPNPPNVTNDTPGLGQSFTLTWTQPTDAIQLYRFYRNDIDDPDTASEIAGVTASLNATSQNFTADELGLALGESTYLYATAVDQAAVDSVGGNGNEGDKSVGWQVTAAETTGFCDATGTCTGCSVAPMTLAGGEPGSISWILALGVGVVLGWRRRR